MRRVHRSGVNSMLRWMGIAIIAVGGLVFGLFPVLAWVLTRSPEAALMLLGLPVAVAAGTVMSVVGTRRRVVITPETVSWCAALGPARTVHFGQVRQVEVPTARSGPGTVVLHLLDGRQVSLSAVRMSLSDVSNHADAGYLGTARALQQAHASWWWQAGPSLRTG